ncbi:MAG: GNAT family N-acetyltransferase [Betaproteobacteria bacterium]
MTIHPLIIRRAEALDAETLAVLATQVWLDNYATEGIHPSIARYVLEALNPTRFEQMLADAATLILVAERGRHVTGMTIVALDRPTPLCDAPTQAEIDRLYVQEPFCNKGIGARLLDQVIAEMQTRGISAIWLQAWVGNARALRFYTKSGFIDAGAAYFELSGKQIENRVLVRRLAAST